MMKKNIFILLAILLFCSEMVAQVGANSAKSSIRSSAMHDSNPTSYPLVVTGETEPNNTAATATALAGNPSKIRGALFAGYDIDYYSFTAMAGDQVYAATMTSFNASYNSDSRLDLLATDGTTVLESDDDDGSMSSASSTIAGATIPVSGTYYLRVQHYYSYVTLRPYDLCVKVQSGSPVAETEPNNTMTLANALPAEGWISGSINPVADQDWISLTLAAGETVFLSLDLNPERDGVNWNGRLGIGMFGDTGDQVLQVDDNSLDSASNPLSEAMFFTAKEAGTYYIVVDGSLPATGGPTATYWLSVSKFSAIPGYVNYSSTDIPKTIPTGPGVVTSTMTITDSKRIKDLGVRINLTHANMPDIDATLTSPNGNVVHLFSDIGSNAQTQMDLLLNDHHACPISSFAAMKGMGYQPESDAFLDYFRNMNTAGTWTLTLYDDLAANNGTLNSWSLDILEELTPDLSEAVILAGDDFEASNGGFTHYGTTDEWEWGTPFNAPITTANSGTKCWKTDLDNPYNPNSNQVLQSPIYDLGQITGEVWISWAMKFQMEDATYDLLKVWVEEAGNPANSKTMFEWQGGTQTALMGSPPLTIQETAGWSTNLFDITSFTGTQVKFKVQLASDGYANYAGVAIDDVKLYNFPVCPPPVLAASGPTTFSCGDSVTLYATGGGNALQFGETGGYVIAPASPDFEFTNGTVELWVKPTFDNLWYYPTLVSNRNSSGTRYSYHLNPDRNGLAFYNGSYAVLWSYSFAQNTWYHVAFVQNGNSTECFVNGNSIGSMASVSSGATGLPLNIGDTQANEVFMGAMDEVRIWDVARTGPQIRESMYAIIQPGSPGLAAYYKLDESSGVIANDATPNGHHGTLVNTPQWIVPSDAPVADYQEYLWSNGDTTASIAVTASGTYIVTATNSSGCQETSAPVTVTVNPVQPPVIVANKPVAFCAGDSVTLTARGNNNSLILNGIDQYVDMLPFSPAPDRTIEFWISFTTAGDGVILSFAGNTNNAIDVLTDQGGIRYNEFDGNLNVGVNTTPINDGFWHHVAIVRTSAPINNVTIYVDGVSNVTGTVNVNTTTNALSAGAQKWFGIVKRYLSASMDEFRIWNVARTNSEIVAGMHGNVPVNSDGLAAYYKFNEGIGNSAADATGHGFNGTLMNSPAWAVPSGVPISGYLTHLWSNGSTTPVITVTESGSYTVAVTTTAGCAADSDTTIVTVTPPLATPVITASGPTSFCSGGSVTLSAKGDAMQFDGIDDYIETGADITDLATANFTIEVWIKTTSSGCGIVNCANDDQSWWPGEKVFYLDLTGQPAFVGWGNGYILSNQAVNDGNWHHVAVVWDYFGSTGRIYVDGTDRTELSGYVANQTNFGSFTIGKPNYAPMEAPNYFAGEMDELRIWNTARTQTELQAEMNQPVAVNSSGLVAYYKFDEGSGNTIADATSHGFTGTLLNGPSWMVPSTSPVPSHLAYLWSNGATTTSITVTSGGMYTVSGTGFSGCTKTSAPVAVAVNPLPAPVITADRLTGLCAGSPVTLTTYGGSNALHFNGISQYVDMQPFSPAPDRTIEFWISFTSSGDGVVLSFAGSTNNAIDVLTGQGGIIYNEYDGNSNVGVMTTPVNDGFWHHIAIVRTSAGTGNVTIYVDGIANATGTVSLNTTTNALSIGAQKWLNITKRYLGPASLDEFRIWDVARTGAEILTGMHDNVPVNSAGLAVYYKFDEVLGITAANATGNGNNGTLMNGAEWILPSTAPISSYSSYLWSNGSTNSTITVTTGGDYTVTATTAAGCTATSEATTLTFIPLPPPAITASGPTTFCSGGSVTLSSNGNAMQFGGTSTYIGTGADIINLTNADFTIEAWIKTTSFDCGIVNCANEDEGWEPGEKVFYLDFLGQPAFVGYGNGYILSNMAVNDGSWHHVAVVWDYSGSGYAGTGKIYIDGTDRTYYSDYIANYSNQGSFNIGKPNYGEAPAYFSGSMDELRMWNKAKSQADLQSAMNQPVPTFSSGLMAYYKFDEGSGATTADATTNGFTGTLVNGPSWIVPSSSPVSSYLAYSWSNGNTTPGITATTSGNYSLTVTNADGCSSSASVDVTVVMFPEGPGMITGPAVTAQGHSGIAYSVDPVANATGYFWNLSPGATIVSGAGTSSITVNFSASAESGNISVYGINECGNGPLSPELTITVLPEIYNPGTTVVPSGTVRCFDAIQTIHIAGSGITFAVLNGGSATMIAGHNIIYHPGTLVEHGGYMHGLITANNQFCGGMAPAMVTVVSGEEPNPPYTSSLTFRVYPNPTTGIFTVEPGGDAEIGKYRVEVVNMSGIRVLSAEMTGKMKQLFTISSMPAGLYFIHIISEEKAETVKLIKM